MIGTGAQPGGSGIRGGCGADNPDAQVARDVSAASARRTATLDLSLSREQDISIQVFDAIGRRVSTVHSGRLAANQVVHFPVDGRTWPSGLYFVRIVGEDFATTRSTVLLK